MIILSTAKCPKCGANVRLTYSEYYPPVDENVNPLLDTVGVACLKCDFEEDFKVSDYE